MNKLFKKGDTVGIIACSNGYPLDKKYIILELVKTLESIGLNVKYSNSMYRKDGVFNGTNYEKAEYLHKFFLDDKIKGIFDISGGDLCNGLLPHIDFDIIKKNPKPFFGYSDLSVLLNAINKMSNISTYNYQIRNLVGKNREIQLRNFINTFMYNKDDLFNFKYKFIQGNTMKGVVVGGNLRCTLKLAGTKFMPDFTNKLFFLESLGGDIAKITTYLNQYNQIGAFEEINGIILGTFTEMEANNFSPNTEEILLSIIPKSIPVIKTEELGHGNDSKCIVLGGYYNFD